MQTFKIRAILFLLSETIFFVTVDQIIVQLPLRDRRQRVQIPALSHARPWFKRDGERSDSRSLKTVVLLSCTTVV